MQGKVCRYLNITPVLIKSEDGQTNGFKLSYSIYKMKTGADRMNHIDYDSGSEKTLVVSNAEKLQEKLDELLPIMERIETIEIDSDDSTGFSMERKYS